MYKIIEKIDALVNTRKLTREQELACDNASVCVLIGDYKRAVKILLSIDFVDLCEQHLQ